MASGIETLLEYKELFDELGVPEGTIKIKIVNRGGSVYGPGEVNEPKSLGRAILNDADDRIVAAAGSTDFDFEVVKVWGGQIESSGLYNVTEDALIRAKLPGGGVLIFDRLYRLDKWQAGFTVEGVVMTWLLICRGSRPPQ